MGVENGIGQNVMLGAGYLFLREIGWVHDFGEWTCIITASKDNIGPEDSVHKGHATSKTEAFQDAMADVYLRYGENGAMWIVNWNLFRETVIKELKNPHPSTRLTKVETRTGW